MHARRWTSIRSRSCRLPNGGTPASVGGRVPYGPVIVHLNGKLVPREQAVISPLDRGFIFGEGVYEGLRAIAWDDPTDDTGSGARIVGIQRHIRRMQLGLNEAGITFDVSGLHRMSREMLKANGLKDAFVYWQVTGGEPGASDPPRHRVAPKGITPTVFGYCSRVPGLAEIAGPMEKRVISCRDPRWELGWLKSTSLMGNVWVAKAAAQRGCDEAILIRGGDERGRGGVVSEGLATNVVLVIPTKHDGLEIVTPSLESAPMLQGVTRDIVLSLAPEIREREVRAEELADAIEVMMVGTTTYVTAIVEIDGRKVSDGRAGMWTRELFGRLMRCYRDGGDIETR